MAIPDFRLYNYTTSHTQTMCRLFCICGVGEMHAQHDRATLKNQLHLYSPATTSAVVKWSIACCVSMPESHAAGGSMYNTCTGSHVLSACQLRLEAVSDVKLKRSYPSLENMALQSCSMRPVWIIGVLLRPATLSSACFAPLALPHVAACRMQCPTTMNGLQMSKLQIYYSPRVNLTRIRVSTLHLHRGSTHPSRIFVPSSLRYAADEDDF